jgi:hypothetical protein
VATPTTKTELLLTSQHELIKQYIELDGQGRTGKIYTASSNAVQGDPCLVTEFAYQSPTSTLIIGRFDGYDTWQVSFVPDSSFTVSLPKDISKTQLLIVKRNELTKQYQELDGQDRPVYVYEAPVIAVTGSPCLVTEYIYQNPTSSIIKGKKEAYASWDETWIPDSIFTVSY